MSLVVLSLSELKKSFGKNPIINGISMDIHKGEFITLLGPSGCGKTTTLRLIAGLEEADSGKIILNGADMTRLDPDKRRVNTVFQNYALFPHLSVFDNVAYGLKIRKVDKAEVKLKVLNMLSLVRMDGYEKRMPNQLSGGQRQRIAIARALINNPDVLLLDEPLGALDLKLRQHMQLELKRIQRETAITCIYVTHDQGEALNLSSRIAVMNNGHFEQIGTPTEIYHKPATRFVAEFVGDRNIIRCVVVENTEDGALVAVGGQKVLCPGCGLKPKDEVIVAVHTDQMRLCRERQDGFFVRATVTETIYAGSQRTLNVVTEDGLHLKVVQYNPQHTIASGEAVYVGWAPEDGVIVSGCPDKTQKPEKTVDLA